MAGEARGRGLARVTWHHCWGWHWAVRGGAGGQGGASHERGREGGTRQQCRLRLRFILYCRGRGLGLGDLGYSCRGSAPQAKSLNEFPLVYFTLWAGISIPEGVLRL